MQIHMEETLLWILDGTSAKTWDEEENKRRIDFVHSLGEKCDCVGWSKLNLSNPNSDEILHRIEDFCKENGWRARGYECLFDAMKKCGMDEIDREWIPYLTRRYII